jgi:hypothetical protein
MEKSYCSVSAVARGSSIFRLAKPARWSNSLPFGGHRDPLSGVKRPERDEHSFSRGTEVKPLTPNELLRLRAVSPSKIKIPSKNMCEKPTNTPIIHSVY